ncbi:aspartate aminotransferase family protein [Bradyrhizobium sp. SSBR45G]|uniref:aminotransferase class III-fold pyridoxal phosphate-dependent enzyme n=1 Tax=unclassified Bradyrhizobium TaxID=2631580 RepID=UPI0023429439|nr:MULTISPECIES: aminotransferase class III-fold pyridoxal phosphate-dependent enzyme [unclassified Bradyrhizobium]GLH79851.1 aspartate aminotransferase family protein [Bradyrhizobium sp. SSBR45G]GLH87227.1 aspartate aminotransferase family protein [Bradyrhizobium sp. SSBR45R]
MTAAPVTPAVPTLSDAQMDAFWMPFTPNRQFKSNPRLFVAAEGMHYVKSDGSRVLDAMAGLWCVNAGHGQTRIVEAIQAQAATLDFVSSFQMSHPAAFELAARIAAIAPEGLDHVFFTNSGSESVDTALKIARAYHRANGQGERIRFISRARAYHGMGWGGLSVSGLSRHRRDFGPLLPEIDHLPHTHDPDHAAFSRGQPHWGVHFADELEKLLALHDPATVAAVIIEPVTGSGGVLPPPVGYLERLREICDRYGILLIFDEVITGFGRIGAAFAANAFGVTPDIITCAKGMTNGAVPMGGVIAHRRIHAAMMSGPPGIELFHGYTYSAHPLACAAALAALDVYNEQDLFGRAQRIAPLWEKAAHALRQAPHVIDIRNIGLLAAIDLKPRDGAPGTRGAEAASRCFDDGVLIRGSSDTLVLSPPLIVTEEQVETIFRTIRRALDAVG